MGHADNGRLGFGLLLTSVHARSVPPDVQVREHRELVSLAVDLGFDLVVAGQHFAAPALRYLQPIPYLATLAAGFPTVRVATGVILLPLLHPLAVAEEVATLDALTGGRAVMGVGIGYAPKELAAFGIDRRSRTARFEESLGIIRRLWSGEVVTHHGRFFDLDDVSTSTLPVQQPHPPVWIGAQAEASVRRAARLADAWYVPPFPTHRELFHLYDLYCEERAGRGRAGPAPIPIRREVYLADSVEAARSAVSAGAGSRYGTYAAWGLDVGTALEAHDWRDSRFLLGDGPTVAEQLAELTSRVPASDVVLKVQWPGQPHADALRQLERFGTEVVPALRPP